MLVIPALASVVQGGRTPLEQAAMPALRSLATAGEVRALLAPADLAQAQAQLLGLTVAGPLGRGDIAVGRALAEGESPDGWRAVEVLDPFGDAAPRLLVARTEDRLLRMLPGAEVRPGRREHELLLRGTLPEALPALAEVTLAWLPTGSRPLPLCGAPLAEVIAPHHSLAAGLAALAGLPRTLLPCQVGDPEIREAVATALRGEHRRLAVVTPPVRPRGLAPEVAHEAMVQRLEELDLTVIAPLRDLAQWRGADLVVTTDLPRDGAGHPQLGPVPWVRRGVQQRRSTAGGLRREALPYVERVLASAEPLGAAWAPGA